MAEKKTAAVTTSDEIVEDVVSSEGLVRINEKKMLQHMANIYRNEKKIDISVSPLYANEFSRNQPVTLNNISLRVPTDGAVYSVPESFAMEIRARTVAADEKFKRLNKMADISNNFERTPGELQLFR